MAKKLTFFLAVLMLSSVGHAQYNCPDDERPGTDKITECFEYIKNLGFRHSTQQMARLCAISTDVNCFSYIKSLGFRHTIEQKVNICKGTTQGCVENMHRRIGGIVEEAGNLCREVGGEADYSCLEFVRGLGFNHSMSQARQICRNTYPGCVERVYKQFGGIVEDAGLACKRKPRRRR